MVRIKTRSDEFREAALYHGSAHPFQVGDIIEPQDWSIKGYSVPIVYTTPQENIARVFAKPSPTRGKPAGSVYRVEPLPKEGEHEGWEMKEFPIKGLPYGSEVLSSTGAKVVENMGHWAPNGKTWHKSPQDSCKSKLCAQKEA